MWGQGFKWRSKVPSQFKGQITVTVYSLCLDHTSLLLKIYYWNALHIHACIITEVYHKHRRSGCQIVTYSNKVTVTLFFIFSITQVGFGSIHIAPTYSSFNRFLVFSFLHLLEVVTGIKVQVWRPTMPMNWKHEIFSETWNAVSTS